MNALQKTAFLARATLRPNAVRFLSQAERAERDRKRAQMQKPGDEPVYLRGGPKDKALFGLSCALIGIGVLHTFWRVYCRM